MRSIFLIAILLTGISFAKAGNDPSKAAVFIVSVMDETGNPLAGVSVKSTELSTTYTNFDGEAECLLSQPVVELVISAPGYMEQKIVIKSDDATAHRKTVKLKPTSVF